MNLLPRLSGRVLKDVSAVYHRHPLSVDIYESPNTRTSNLRAMENLESARIRERIRELRRERGLTLLAFEKRSGGRIRAVVLGAYERGDRSMTLEKIIEIASVLDVGLSHLVESTLPMGLPSHGQTRHIYDLVKLRALEESDEKQVLSRYIARVAQQRRDWAGQIISLRSDDIEALSRVIDSETVTFKDWAFSQGIILKKR